MKCLESQISHHLFASVGSIEDVSIQFTQRIQEHATEAMKREQSGTGVYEPYRHHL